MTGNQTLSVLSLTKSTGGLAHYNKMLCTGLDPLGFETFTLCLSDQAETYAEDLRQAGLQAGTAEMARYHIDPLSDARLFRHIRKLVGQLRPDVILGHGSKAGLLARAVGAIAGVPAVYAQASLPFITRVQGRKAYLYRGLEFVARLFGGHIVTLTSGAKEATVGHGLSAASRVTVIPTGVETQRFAPTGKRSEAIQHFDLDPERPVVGWAGRFERQKAPEHFLAAIASVVHDIGDAQFLMAGEGSQKAETVDLAAELGVAKNVRFVPWQTDVIRLLEAMDLFVMTSRWEGLPLSLLEAMAMGCVPVATRADGIVDVIEQGKNGYLAAIGDHGAIAEAIVRLLKNEGERGAMSQAARERIQRHFSRQQMLYQWQDLMVRLARGRGTDRATVPA
ncbi:MAG: glycosyltransferase [Geminicoccaceae bacterium]